jgi:oligopeptidase A
MRLHDDFDPASGRRALDLLDEVRQQVAVMVPPAYNRFPNSFSNIFAGGYAAGYYSYKWAEVLSADAFSVFEEAGLDDEAALGAAGRRFRETVLSQGGSRPPMDVFKSFRGREPSTEALLRHQGLAAT